MQKYPFPYPAILKHNVKRNYKSHHSTQRYFSTEGTKVNLHLFITWGINTDKTRTLVSIYYKGPDQKEFLKASPQVLQSVQEPSYLKQASWKFNFVFIKETEGMFEIFKKLLHMNTEK